MFIGLVQPILGDSLICFFLLFLSLILTCVQEHYTIDVQRGCDLEILIFRLVIDKVEKIYYFLTKTILHHVSLNLKSLIMNEKNISHSVSTFVGDAIFLREMKKCKTHHTFNYTI